MKRYILSIDGGGIRGLIPAIILANIENQVNLPISRIFDLITGTSTGAILASGLCKKNTEGKPEYSAQNLLEFYEEHGSYIFKSSFLRKKFSWLYNSEYSNTRIEYILDQYFQNNRLDSSLKPLLISSYDIYNNQPFFFKSWKKNRNSIKMSDAIRASTAAPVYFSPKFLEIGSKKRVLIDGGIFANNPSACAYSSAKKMFNPKDRIIILSLGTGTLEEPITYDKSKRFGKISWIRPLIDNIFNSSLDLVDYQMNELLGKDYIRIQSEIKFSSYHMDDASRTNIKNLIQEAYLLLKQNRYNIDKFCESIS